jgi:uncharacterized membrane protein
MSETIIVVHPYTVSSDIADVGRKFGWRLIATIPRGERRLFEEVWETPEGAQVRYIDDHFVQVPFVAVTGPGQLAIEHGLRSMLRTRTYSEVMNAANSGKGKERAQAIRALAAVTSNVVEPAVTAAVIAAADDADVQVRLAAIKAMARMAAPSFRTVVAKRLVEETDALLRPEIESLSVAMR